MFLKCFQILGIKKAWVCVLACIPVQVMIISCVFVCAGSVAAADSHRQTVLETSHRHTGAGPAGAVPCHTGRHSSSLRKFIVCQGL